MIQVSFEHFPPMRPYLLTRSLLRRQPAQIHKSVCDDHRAEVFVHEKRNDRLVVAVKKCFVGSLQAAHTVVTL
ncbi:MAG: hypothetical protein M1305_05700, partial [Candidatus Marsarchaeota archaeon]|nr:hypothetical protein [Candidatus Marsarchaeota archaeon]